MGCVFYEMLTCHTPFHAHNMEGCRRQHMEETPKLPSELRPELADWTGLDGLVMRMLAKNRDDRPQDAEVLSLLDGVQSAPGGLQSAPSKQWQKTVAAEAWQRPQTISDESMGRYEPLPSQVSQPVWQPVNQTPPAIQAQKPASGKIPVWVWGVVAVPVLAAGITAAWLIAHKPQPPQTQAEVTQPAVIPPLQAGTNTNAPLTSSSNSQKPSPATAASNTNTKPATGSPANPSVQQPTQATNTKPSIVLPNIVLPQKIVLPQIVKPTAQQPSTAEITQQALLLYGQKRFSEASPLLDKACTGGSGEACKDLGNLYHDGNGVTKDGSRAASLYSKACGASAPMGCNSLGVMYHNGDGVAQDDTRAAALYSQACNAGDALGCTNLGNSYWNGKGVPHDDSRAAAFYSKACDASNGAGCSSLGLCFSYGRGVAKDPARARQLFTKGCGMGNSWGCDQLKMLK
jgi:TPR repeat protein